MNLGSGTTAAQADADIAWARRLHVQLVRVDAPWSQLQPNGPEINPEALTFLDRLTTEASAAGIRVILTAFSTPCWASSAPSELLSSCQPGTHSAANAWPPGDPSTYASYVAYLAVRYGGSLAAIEVWNEPDQANQLYFAGPEKATRYAALLRAAYAAIKQANPSVSVLGGSLVGSNGAFLRALYQAGIKGYYDGLSIHFYNLVLGSIRAIHQVQSENGDLTPLWLSEFGWSSCYPHQRIQQEQACVSTKVQARNITNVYRSLARTSYMAADVLYALGSSPTEDFGVVSTRGTRKPAFTALRRAALSPLSGRVSRVALRLRRRGAHIIASGSGPVGDYMQLEAFSGSVLRYRALFTLNRFNRFSLELPAAVGIRGVTVRVFQYWAGPGSATQRTS